MEVEIGAIVIATGFTVNSLIFSPNTDMANILMLNRVAV